MLKRFYYINFLLLISFFPIYAEQEPSAKTLKYHQALQSRPLNEQLFERFYQSWSDELGLNELETFLKSSNPKNWQHWALLARYQMRRGQSEEAIDSLDLALTEEADNTALLLLRAKLSIRNLQFDAAITYLKKITPDESKQSMEAIRLLGSCYIRVGEVDSAVKLWSKAINTTDLGIDFVDSAATEGEYEKAIELCDILIKKTTDPYEKVNYRIRLAELQGIAAQSGLAKETFKAVLADTGSDSWLEADILRKIDSLFERQGDLPGQVSFYKALYEDFKQRVSIKSKYAFLLAESDDWDQSLKLYQELLLSAPDNQELRRNFIILLSHNDKNDEALKELDLLIKQAGSTETLLIQRIQLLNKLDRKNEVTKVIEQIANIKGDTESDKISLSQLYAQNGFQAAAKATLEKAAALPNAQLTKEALAQFHLKNNDTEQGITILESMLEGSNLETLLRISNSIARAGEPEKSYAALQKRHSEFSNQATYLHTLCQLSLSTSKEEECVSSALDLVHLAEHEQELLEAIKMAQKVIIRAELQEEHITKLQSAADISDQDLCLLLALLAKKNIDQARIIVTENQPNSSTLVSSFWANLLIQNKLTEEAVGVLEELTKTPSGRNASALRKLCQIQKSLGDNIKALATCQQWKEIAPNDKIVWLWESELLTAEGQGNKAISVLRRAIARFDKADDLKSILSKQYLEEGMYDDAYNTLWAAFENTPSIDSKMHWSRQLIELSYDLSTLSNLKKTFLQRKARNPKSLAPILALIQISEKEKDLDSEKAYTLEALSLQPNNEKLLLRLGKTEESLGKSSSAEKYYLQAVDIAKSNTSYNQLIRFYLRSGYEAKAFALAKRKTEFKSIRDEENVAIEIYLMGYLEVALAGIEAVATANPQDWRVNYLHGLLLEDAGEAQQAAQIFYSLANASGELAEVEEKKETPTSFTMPIFQYYRQAYGHYSHVYNNYRGSGSKPTDKLYLPNTAAEARELSRIHLIHIAAKEGDTTLTQEIFKHLNDENFQEPEVTADLFLQVQLMTRSRRQNTNSLTIDLFKKHPNSKILIQADMQKMINSVTPSIAASALPEFNNDPEIQLYLAHTLLLKESTDDEFQLGFKTATKILNDKREYYLKHKHDYSASMISQPAYFNSDRLSSIKTLYEQSLDYSLEERKQDPHELIIQNFFSDLIILSIHDDKKRLLEMLNRPKLANTTPNSHQIYYNQRQDFSYLLTLDQSSLRDILQLGYQRDLTKAHLSKLKTTLVSLLPQIEPSIVKVKILYLNDQVEDAKDELTQLLSNPEIPEGYIYRLLAAIELKNKKPLLAFEHMLEIRKNVPSSDFYNKYNTDADILKLAVQLEPEEVSPHLAVLSKALARFTNKSGHTGTVAREIGEKLGIKASRSQSTNNKKVQSTRKTALEGLTSMPFEQRHKRVDNIAKAGNKDLAAKVASRLIQSRLSMVYNQTDGLDDLLTAITDNDLTDAILAYLKQGIAHSALKNETYLIALQFLGREDEIPEAIAALEDTRVSESWKKCRTALVQYPSDPEGALEILQSLSNNGKTITIENPAFVDYDIDMWYNWGSLVADFTDSLNISELKGQDMNWLTAFTTDIANSKNIRRGSNSYINSVFEKDRGYNKSKQNERRRANVVTLSESMLDHPDTALHGFLFLKILSAKELTSTDNTQEWLQKTLLSGALEGESQAQNRFNDSRFSRYAEGLSVSFAEVLCSKIKQTGREKAFAKEFLDRLSKENEAAYSMLMTLDKLSKASADTFDSVLEKTTEEWKKKSTAHRSLAKQLHIFKLYTKERAQEELALITEKLQSLSNLNYQDRQNLQTRVTNLFILAAEDISTDYITELFKQFAESVLPDRKEWDKTNNLQQSSRSIEGYYRDLTRVLIKNKLLIPAIIKSCWIHELPNTNGSYEITQSITDKTYNSPDDIISYLETLGLLSDPNEYFPLTSRRSEWNNIYKTQSIEAPLLDLSRRINHDENWNTAIENLIKRKKGRFGSLLTAACISKDQDQKKELINLAFNEHAEQLSKLENMQILALYHTFKKYIAEAPETQDKNLVLFYKKMNELKTEESLKAIEKQLVELDSGEAFNNNVYQVVQSTAEQLSNMVSYDFQKSLDLIKRFEKAFSKSLKQGGKFSSYTSSSQVSSLYEDLLQLSLSKMIDNNVPVKEVTSWMSAITEDEHLAKLTDWNSSSHYSIEKLVSKVIDKTHKQEGHSSNQKHLSLDILANEWNKLPGSSQKALRAGLLFKHTGNSSWSVSLEDPVIQSWKEKSQTSDLFKTLLLIAEMRCKEKIEVKAKRSLQNAIAHIQDETIHSSFRLHFASDYLRNFKTAIQSAEFNVAVIATQKQHLNGKRSARTTVQQKLFSAYNSALDSTPELALNVKPLLTTWNEASRIPLRGEPKNVYSSLAKEMMIFAATTREFQIFDRLLSYSKEGINGNIPILMELIQLDKFDTAKKLLPLPEKAYPIWTTDKTYTAAFETKLREFITQLNNPSAAFRLECELLYIKFETADGQSPQESPRDIRTRLTEQYSSIEKINDQARVEALVALTLSNFGQDTNVQNIKEIIADKSFETLLKNYSKSSSNRHLEWQLDLYLIYAMTEMKAGNFIPLETMVKTFEKSKDDSNALSRSEYIQADLGRQMALPVIDLLQAGNEEQLKTLLPLLQRLANHALEQGISNNYCRTSPLAYAKLVSHALGKREEINKWGDHLSADAKKQFNAAMKRANIPVYIAWPLYGDKQWFHPKNKELRNKVFHWIFSNKEALNSMMPNFSWAPSYVSKYGLTIEETHALADDPDILSGAKSSLLLFRAKSHRKNKKPEKSLIDYQTALDLMPKEELRWDMLYNHNAISTAEFHLLQEQKVEAEKLIQSLRNDKISAPFLKKKNKILEQLK